MVIINIDEKYRKKEDFINDFKEREEQVAERLLYLKEKKEEERNDKYKKATLNIIEEALVDDEDNFVEKNNKSDNENEIKHKESIKEIQNQCNIKTVFCART